MTEPVASATATDAVLEALADLDQRMARIERILARPLEWQALAERQEPETKT